jgi:hypothetical protein
MTSGDLLVRPSPTCSGVAAIAVAREHQIVRIGGAGATFSGRRRSPNSMRRHAMAVIAPGPGSGTRLAASPALARTSRPHHDGTT